MGDAVSSSVYHIRRLMTPICPFFPVLSILVKVLSPSFLLYEVTLLSPLLLNLWESTLRLIKYPGKVELKGFNIH